MMKEKYVVKQRQRKRRKEGDLYDMLEKADAKKKEKKGDKDKLGDKLEAFLAKKVEGDEATSLMEEMRKTVEAVQQELLGTEQSLCNALRESVDNHGREQDQPRTLMTKCWQSEQSQDTNNLNLEDNLEDIHSTIKRAGGSEEDKTRRLWAQDEGDEQRAPQP